MGAFLIRHEKFVTRERSRFHRGRVMRLRGLVLLLLLASASASPFTDLMDILWADLKVHLGPKSVLIPSPGDSVAESAGRRHLLQLLHRFVADSAVDWCYGICSLSYAFLRHSVLVERRSMRNHPRDRQVDVRLLALAALVRLTYS